MRRFARERLQHGLAGLQPFGARVAVLPVNAHHAFLAHVRVDAGESERETRVGVFANPHQAVEDRLARGCRGPRRIRTGSAFPGPPRAMLSTATVFMPRYPPGQRG